MIFFIASFICLFSLGTSIILVFLAKSLAWQLGRGRLVLLSVLLALAYTGLWFFIASVFPEYIRSFKNTLGVLTLAVCLSAIYLVIRVFLRMINLPVLIQKHHGRWVVGVYILLVAALSLLGSYNFHKPIAVEEFTITSKKITKPYRFVHLSDIQYGTSTRAEMDKILALAYAQHSDFIVFTGDLIDFNHYSFADFKKLAASPVPIFFERGNHEFYHHPVRLLNFLKKIAPIDVLINRSTDFDELQIIGLDFSRAPDNVQQQLQRIKVNPNKLSILLYHEPRDVEVAAGFGIDILLYGHTHAGQMWPYTWVVDLLYKYSDGAFQVGNSFAYTSDGASLWGPRMRLGSQNEIVVFNLHPE